jgi:tetratricopeptide (TPR) repeat protein
MCTITYKACLLLLLLGTADTRSQTPDAQAKFRLAQGLEQAGDDERAGEMYRLLLNGEPQNLVYFEGVHRTAMQLKNYDDAIAVIKARMTFFPADIPLHAMLGTAYYRAGREQEAMDVWNTALTFQPANVQAYRVVANVLIENRLLDRAAEVYRRGQAVSDDPSVFSVELAQLLAASTDYGGATAEYLRWLSKNPAQLGFVQNRMATFSWKTEGRSAAIATVRTAIASVLTTSGCTSFSDGSRLRKDFLQAFDIYRRIDQLTRANGVAILALPTGSSANGHLTWLQRHTGRHCSFRFRRSASPRRVTGLPVRLWSFR